MPQRAKDSSLGPTTLQKMKSNSEESRAYTLLHQENLKISLERIWRFRGAKKFHKSHWHFIPIKATIQDSKRWREAW